ncbi:MAG: acyl-CoA dehydrogenase family protein [Myxococcota bacterium]
MDFTFTDEQQALRETARAFLAEHSSSEQVRKAMESELGYSPDLWRRIGSDLGWTALLIPEVLGGLGLGFVELVALLETMGEFLLCAPFFSSICLGANALLVAGSEAQKRELLPALAEGALCATLAVPPAPWDGRASGMTTTVERCRSGFVLRGECDSVLDGHSADLLVIPATPREGAGEVGASLFLVSARSAGLQRAPLPTLDRTRRLARLRFADVELPESALLGDEGRGGELLERVLERACVALAAEQVGLAQHCLDLTVAHAQERIQFDRPIGSFQAVKHLCADMLVHLESARSAAYYAACAAAEGSDELPVLASLAKVVCSEASFHCAASALQIHGGVGFTWEYDLHLYLKRARASESFLGDPGTHRERIARRIGL